MFIWQKNMYSYHDLFSKSIYLLRGDIIFLVKEKIRNNYHLKLWGVCSEKQRAYTPIMFVSDIVPSLILPQSIKRINSPCCHEQSTL
jgi:hypothetical protein